MGGSAFVYSLYRLSWSALDWIFPPVCGGCGSLGSRWCATCQKNVPVIDGNVCDSCGTPQNVVGLCDRCRKERPPYHALRSWLVFDDPIRSALHRLKYRRDMGLGDAIAAQLAGFVGSLGWQIEVVVPIPLSETRRKERGYNQVALISRPLSMALGFAYAPNALVRWRNTHSQVGLNREQRMENVRGVFRADQARVHGKNILLVDDVATTGSTLVSGAEALLSAGASQVYALTVARALTRHGLHHV